MISMMFLKLPPKKKIFCNFQFLHKQIDRTLRLASGPMCDAEKEWQECSFHDSGAITVMAAAKNFLSTNRKSNFLSLVFQLLACNSILFCLLAYHVSIFIVSFSNLSVVRHCRMQECPTFHDQDVLYFASTLDFRNVRDEQFSHSIAKY